MQADHYERVFDAKMRDIASVAELVGTVMPRSFIGFIGANNRMVHAMIYIGDGFGGGNKNSCVFSSGKHVGWERLDLRGFFGVDAQMNARRRMVARAVEGQIINTRP
jgi:hypothetical protein